MKNKDVKISVLSEIAITYNNATKEVIHLPIIIELDQYINELPDPLIVLYNEDIVRIEVDNYEFLDDKTIKIHPKYSIRECNMNCVSFKN